MHDKPAILSDILSGYPEISLAMLFGSQSAGSARADSDIDLGILCEQPLTAAFKQQIIESVSLASGLPVDLIDLYGAPEPVVGEALNGKRLLGSDAVYADLLSRHLLNTQDFLPIQQRILAERRDAWLR
jgi:predicted nucleotidyltransferase